MDIEAEIDHNQEKAHKVQEKKEKSKSEKILMIPSQKSVMVEEAESQFQKNFKRLSLSKNVSLVNKAKSVSRKSQFYMWEKSEPKKEVQKIAYIPQQSKG